MLDFPILDFPPSENPMQLNKDISSKDKIIIDEINYPFLSVSLISLLPTNFQNGTETKIQKSILHRERKRFIRLRSLGYPTAKTGKAVKDAQACYP